MLEHKEMCTVSKQIERRGLSSDRQQVQAGEKSQNVNTFMGGKALAADVTNAGGIMIINCA